MNYICAGCFEFETNEIPAKCPNCHRQMKPPGFPVSFIDVVQGNILHHLNKAVIREITEQMDQQLFAHENH